MNTRYNFIEQQLRDYKANKGIIAASTPESMSVPPSAQWSVAAIDDLLNIVSEEEKAILEARYFRIYPLTAWQVANMMNVSRTEFYRRRNMLLDWLDKRMGYPVLNEVKECM